MAGFTTTGNGVKLLDTSPVGAAGIAIDGNAHILNDLLSGLGAISGSALYVSTTGDDDTGGRGRPDKPFETLDAAIGAASAGDTIYVGIGTFAPITVTIPAYVSIIGGWRPHVDSTSAPTTLVGGTTIQGPLIFSNDGFGLCNAGVDSGSAVCTALYSGVAQEGLIISQSFPKRDIRISNVISLCKAPDSTVHACAFEGVQDSTFVDIETWYGVHGVALKGLGCFAGRLRCHGHAWNAVIVKVNNNRPCQDNVISDVIMEFVSTLGDCGGMTLQAGEGGESPALSMAQIVISNVVALGCSFALKTVVPSSNVINDIQIRGIQSHACAGGIQFLGATDRLKLSGFVITGASSHGVTSDSSTARLTISDGTIASCGGDALHLDGTTIAFGGILSQSNTGYGVNAVSTTVYKIGGLVVSGGGGSTTGNTITTA